MFKVQKAPASNNGNFIIHPGLSTNRSHSAKRLCFAKGIGYGGFRHVGPISPGPFQIDLGNNITTNHMNEYLGRNNFAHDTIEVLEVEGFE
jgi:hypothetical protein